MRTKAQQGRAIQAESYRWWRPLDRIGEDAAGLIHVSTDTMLDLDWCAIRNVSLGATPHRVEFCRDSHTLMIFDRGSFVEGERWVDGTRLATSGPLDIGLDVVPAHSEFTAWAGPGSNVKCTMISVAAESFAALEGKQGMAHPLRPAVGLESDLLSPLIARMRELCRTSSGSKSDRLYLEALCVVLFREVMRAQQQACLVDQRPTGGLSPRAQRVIRDFLQENIGLKIDLQDLADQVGVSRFHFTRAFKVSFGLPPYKYLLNMRLRKAAELLQKTRNPITEVALNVGFSCSSEFARAFKQAMGCTPREFRQGGG
jgi:AraC family transcriptional regulator